MLKYIYTLIQLAKFKEKVIKKKYVFKRNELKYVITPEIMRLLIDKFSKFVEPDEYGETTVYSLYYDTPDKRIIRKSVNRLLKKSCALESTAVKRAVTFL